MLPLTRGLFALLDDSDWEWASQYRWYANQSRPGVFYARRVEDNQYFHRLLVPGSPQVDHRDNQKLNCQRTNLRACTNTQNSQARRKLAIGKTSQFRGVSWHRQRKRWRAYLVLDGRQQSLGYFDNQILAARAYDVAARRVFGAFAAPNFD